MSNKLKQAQAKRATKNTKASDEWVDLGLVTVSRDYTAGEQFPTIKGIKTGFKVDIPAGTTCQLSKSPDGALQWLTPVIEYDEF